MKPDVVGVEQRQLARQRFTLAAQLDHDLGVQVARLTHADQLWVELDQANAELGLLDVVATA
jgi:hypothetical protein